MPLTSWIETKTDRDLSWKKYRLFSKWQREKLKIYQELAWEQRKKNTAGGFIHRIVSWLVLKYHRKLSEEQLTRKRWQLKSARVVEKIADLLRVSCCQLVPCDSYQILPAWRFVKYNKMRIVSNLICELSAFKILKRYAWS